MIPTQGAATAAVSHAERRDSNQGAKPKGTKPRKTVRGTNAKPVKPQKLNSNGNPNKTEQNQCGNCGQKHASGRCPAKGKQCFHYHFNTVCKEKSDQCGNNRGI